MKTERELYEELQNKSVLKRLVFIDSLSMYLTKDEYSDDDLTIQYCLEINHGWKMWQASANREGYRLVPVEATHEMIDALRFSCVLLERSGISDMEANGAYQAMINAI